MRDTNSSVGDQLTVCDDPEALERLARTARFEGRRLRMDEDEAVSIVWELAAAGQYDRPRGGSWFEIRRDLIDALRASNGREGSHRYEANRTRVSLSAPLRLTSDHKSDLTVSDLIAEPGPDPEDRAVTADQAERACAAFDLLTPTQSEVFRRLVEGESQISISRRLGVTDSRVSQIVREGRRCLRSHVPDV